MERFVCCNLRSTGFEPRPISSIRRGSNDYGVSLRISTLTEVTNVIRTATSADIRRASLVARVISLTRSNQRIAHDLVVALDTVKTHVTHVLRKLGAANRTEAAARARQLSLIPDTAPQSARSTFG